MTWETIAYMVAGGPLCLLVLWLEKGYLDSFDWRLAVFAGWLVGVPVFLFVMVFLFNWGKFCRVVYEQWHEYVAAASIREAGKE